MGTDVSTAAPRRGSRRVGSVVAAVAVVVGLVLAPLAVVAAQARPLLTDTDAFVATFAPLAADRGVQDAVADAAIAAVDARVDFGALVDRALQDLSLPPAALVALRALGNRAADALRAVVDEQIRAVVSSAGFATVWRQMLRSAHATALAGIAGTGPLVVAGDTLVLQVGPVVDLARQALLDHGNGFAALVPPVDRAVELVTVPGLGQVAAGHGAVAALGLWLPIAALVLVVGGVALARRRRVAALRAGVGLALACALLLVVLAVVRARLGAPAGDPGAASLDRSRALLRVAAYDATAGGIVRDAATLLAVGLVAALAAHLVGRLLAPPPAAAPPAAPLPAEPAV